MKDDIRSVPIHQSLTRPELVMGGEREPVMGSTLFAGITAFEGIVQHEWVAVLLAGTFWFVCIFALRRMAKADPMMSRVWGRYMQYQSVYSARSSCWAVRAYVRKKK